MLDPCFPANYAMRGKIPAVVDFMSARRSSRSLQSEQIIKYCLSCAYVLARFCDRSEKELLLRRGILRLVHVGGPGAHREHSVIQVRGPLQNVKPIGQNALLCSSIVAIYRFSVFGFFRRRKEIFGFSQTRRATTKPSLNKPRARRTEHRSSANASIFL